LEDIQMAISTIPLFKNTQIGARGTAGTVISDVVDLRQIANVGNFSLTYVVGGTGGITAGTSTFEYLLSSGTDGTFFAAGTFGTNAPAGGTGIVSLGTVQPAPFIKVKVVSGTSNPTVVTAELNVR
jgi:hypothetical protein